MADPIYISPSAKLEAKHTPWWTTDINSGLNRLYDTLIQSPYNKVFNQNDQDAIASALSLLGQGGPGAGSSQAMMPALGKNNPRIQELYKKLLGFYPYGKVEVTRKQFEDPSTLASHKSRGGIFVVPSTTPNISDTLLPREYRHSPSLKEVNTTVELTNPLVKFNNILVASAFGNSSLSDMLGVKHAPTRYRKLYNALLDQASKSFEATDIASSSRTALGVRDKAERMVLPDLIAAKFAKDSGFDALIPATRRAYSANNPVEEMMLLPNRKEGNTIYRDESKVKWKLPNVPEHKYSTVENAAGEKFGVVPLEGFTPAKVQVLFDVLTKHNPPEYAIKQLKALGAIK